MEKLNEFLDIVVNKKFPSSEMCGSVVNNRLMATSMCPYFEHSSVDCPNCIFDKKSKPSIIKANKILISLKE